MLIAYPLSNVAFIGAILNLKSVGMSYIKYERDIVTKYKVKLIGWPPTVKFASPSEIGTVDDIRLVRQALIVGDCKWMVQTRRQQQAHIEMLEARVAAGEVVGKKRKQRSDKGKTRKKSLRKGGKAGEKHRNEDTDSEDISQKNSSRPLKKKRKTVNDDTDEDISQKKNSQPLKKKRKTVAAARMLPPAVKSREFINDSDDDSEGEDSD
jgi:hypothetical protein